MTGKLADLARGMPRTAVDPAGALITLGVAWLDARIGGFSALYLAPLALVAWRGTAVEVIAQCALIVAARISGRLVAGGWPALDPAALLSAADLGLLAAAFALVLVELRGAQRRLAALSLVDRATGLLNRRALLERISEEQQRVRRHSIPLTISRIHLEGLSDEGAAPRRDDSLVREIARAFDVSLRATDTVARLGGGEFALLLPETDEAQARVAVSKLRESLARATAPLGRSLRAQVGSLTCSKPELEPEEMLSAADELMPAARSREDGIASRALG